MKNIYSIIMRFVVVAVAITGFASCVRPDLSDCVDPRGNVRLVVDLDAYFTSINGGSQPQIDNIIVYVFDADNRYVTHCKGGAYTGQAYEFFLSLKGGEHHFVAWTNHGDSYKPNISIETCEANRPRMNELHFLLQYPADNRLHTEIPDLLHGIAKGEHIIKDRNNYVQVLMSPNNYNINVKVKGIPSNSDMYDFTITDNNSHYTFENSIIDGKDNYHHIRTSRHEKNELNVSFKTLTLARDRSPQFVFRNATQDDVLFDKCLVQTILNAYETSGQTVDFDNTRTFDIELIYDTDMDVTVSVNGWDYVPGNEDLE